MKKLATLALTLALGASLAAPALAANDMVIAPNPNAQPAYATTIILNGKTLDTSKLPAGDGIPMRLVSESDYGFSNWFAEENTGYFTFDTHNVNVDFKTGAVDVSGTAVEGVTAVATEGVTFLPVSILESFADYKVEKTDTTITITTPNADPATKLCREIMTETQMGNGMKAKDEDLYGYLGMKKENYASVVAFTPMVINADTVIIAKANPGKLDAVKADLTAQQERTIKNFETYLPAPLEMAKAGKVVSVGDWAMLIISPDTAKATQLFEQFVAAQK
ncbi:MAG: DUF4358 domain-containing protein [Pseudoflavonifractor sp.]